MSIDQSEMPESLPGFEHILRNWHAENELMSVNLLPGQFYVTRHKEAISTVLGSCVSACIRDVVSGVGGMNHFMLPESTVNDATDRQSSIVSKSARFGNFAMEHLINTILRHGGQKKHLEIKLFGGSRIIPEMVDIGRSNINYVLDYIKVEGLNLVAQDLGDIHPRKVVFFPNSGRVRVRKLQDIHNQSIVHREMEYRDRINDRPVQGTVELF